MRTDLELVTRFLVNVGTTQNGEFLDLVWQWDRAANSRAGPLGSVDDLLCAGVQYTIVKCLEPNTDILALH